MWSISWLLLLEAVVIVLGNAFTIVIFTRSPRLRSRQYALMVNLAVADLFVGLVSVPMYIAYQENPVIAAQHWLVLWSFDNFFGTASLLGLAALAIERTHATYFPFKHYALTKAPYIFTIIAVWATSFVIAAASYLNTINFIAFIAIKVGTIAIALLIIACAYFLIYFNVNCMVTAPRPALLHQSNKKLTITLSIATIISLLTWIPYQVFVIYTGLHHRQSSAVYESFQKACRFLHFSNSFANIFVYVFRMREFKKEMLRRINCFNCCKIDIQDNNAVSDIVRPGFR